MALRMITQKELALQDGKQVEVTFKPGPLGLTHDSGVVRSLEESGQAQALGVMAGWRLAAVNGEGCAAFDAENFAACQKGSTPYKVTFTKECWICMHNLVFNVASNDLDEHPGGPDVITILGGKDATEDFEDIAHSAAARDWANKLIIGYKEGAPDNVKTMTKMPDPSSDYSSKNGGGFPVMPTVLVGVAASVLFMFLRMRR